MAEIEISTHSIRLWIQTVATGEFHFTAVLGLNRILETKENQKLRNVIHELTQQGICEPVGSRDGFYRPIQELPPPVDWQSVRERQDSGLILPFDLRRYSFIYPDTTTIVAGSKSSGKSGFLYRVVGLNMYRKKTHLLTNMEGGVAMLRDRLYAMDIEIPNPAPFRVDYALDNFHDFIRERDTVYVVDYIDAPEGVDFFKIAAKVSQVDKRLRGLNSEAVIGLQKPIGRDTAWGGEMTKKVATLYLSMDTNSIKIIDAKVPADEKVNPNNMKWTFRYSQGGTNFFNITPDYGD